MQVLFFPKQIADFLEDELCKLPVSQNLFGQRADVMGFGLIGVIKFFDQAKRHGAFMTEGVIEGIKDVINIRNNWLSFCLLI